MKCFKCKKNYRHLKAKDWLHHKQMVSTGTFNKHFFVDGEEWCKKCFNARDEKFSEYKYTIKSSRMTLGYTKANSILTCLNKSSLFEINKEGNFFIFTGGWKDISSATLTKHQLKQLAIELLEMAEK